MTLDIPDIDLRLSGRSGDLALELNGIAWVSGRVRLLIGTLPIGLGLSLFYSCFRKNVTATASKFSSSRSNYRN